MLHDGIKYQYQFKVKCSEVLMAQAYTPINMEGLQFNASLGKKDQEIPISMEKAGRGGVCLSF
jgi:hypothetical protein